MAGRGEDKEQTESTDRNMTILSYSKYRGLTHLISSEQGAMTFPLVSEPSTSRRLESLTTGMYSCFVPSTCCSVAGTELCLSPHSHVDGLEIRYSGPTAKFRLQGFVRIRKHS
jgi:hypothetical protein